LSSYSKISFESPVLACGLWPAGAGTAVLASLAAILVLTPAVRLIATKLGAVDRPSGRRVHARATPRMGGLAVYIAFWVGVAVLWERGLVKDFHHELSGFGLGSLLLVLLGIYDDLRDAPIWLKFPVQLLAAHLVFWTGLRFTMLTGPVGTMLPLAVQSTANYAISILWVVGVTNAVNFMDGLDFLCSGISVVGFLGLTLVAIVTTQLDHVPLYAVSVTVLCGFAVFNWNPASIFLGDSGSTFLGFGLACFTQYQFARIPHTIATGVAPVTLLLLPIADTLYAIARRMYMGVSPTAADRGHLHHRLLALGLSVPAVVLAICAGCALLSVASAGIVVGPIWLSLSIIAIVLASMYSVARALGLFDPDVIAQGLCINTLLTVKDHATPGEGDSGATGID
jgi:UDP-GlcNAc:undecaprenyl-phosphate GlcNAc-1-phosphate transferase